MNKIRGPYYRAGHYIRGDGERIVLMVDCWDQHGEAERLKLTSDLIDFLSKRDEERKNAKEIQNAPTSGR